MSPYAGTLRPAAFHILLALAGGDLHGLAIAEAVDEATDGRLRLGPGTLYRTLKELRSEGRIEEVELADGEDPRRRPYRLTEAGRRLIEAEAARLDRIVEVARERAVLPQSR